jgi:hypothetical protein
MTSQLTYLRRQLLRLGHARAAVRVTAAVSALWGCILASLLTLWALDALLWLSRGQRLAALGLIVALWAWVWRRYARSQLLARESLAELALTVERRYGIDTDLLAALQFDAAQDYHGGSPRLAQAVIDQVAQRARQIDPFAGFSMRPAVVRLALAAALTLTALALVFQWPEHARVFWHRLLLSSVRYPTQTRIAWVIVPPATLLAEDAPPSALPSVDIAEGKPVYFFVVCRGRLPTSGSVELKADGPGGGVASLPLTPLSLSDRKALLERALRQLSSGVGLGPVEPGQATARPGAAGHPSAELQALVALDAPQAARVWRSDPSPTGRATAMRLLEETLSRWPASTAKQVVLTGRLDRLPSDLEYRVFAGDAAIGPGRLRKLPLPIVELELVARPPAYAAAALPVQRSRQTQLAVLEGSRVELSVRCVNGKRLQAVWLTLPGTEAEPTPRRWPLVPAGPGGDVWRVAHEESPLAAVRDDLRFQVEVIDADGLQPAAPIGGYLRCLRDQPPSVWLSTIHRVVLPQAMPAIHYRVTDDFGVAAVWLHVEVERRTAPGEEPRPSDVRTIEVYAAASQADAPAAGRAPTELRDAYRLPLAVFALHKGDRVKLVLEARDARGQNEPDGEATAARSQSEPLMLEVSDESGVLAAIAEADAQAAEALSELIQRQQSVGETP